MLNFDLCFEEAAQPANRSGGTLGATTVSDFREEEEANARLDETSIQEIRYFVVLGACLLETQFATS